MKAKETETFALVYPDEANIAEGKLFALTPLRTAISGYRLRDLVRWLVLSGMGR